MTKSEPTPNILPNHLGLILDGNRRWAKERGLPTLEGHRQGSETFKRIIKAAFKRNIAYVSAYVFSTENWKRTEEEVSYLMGILLKFVENDLMEIHKDNIRVVILGTTEGLTQKVASALERVEKTTKANTAGTLALCFNYGGRQELVDAVKRLVADGVAPNEVNESLIDGYVYHPEVPQVDLIIRTSGEQRLSNFMLWRSSYAELLFVDKYWPDFTETDLEEALTVYAGRHRRIGS